MAIIKVRTSGSIFQLGPRIKNVLVGINEKCVTVNIEDALTNQWISDLLDSEIDRRGVVGITIYMEDGSVKTCNDERLIQEQLATPRLIDEQRFGAIWADEKKNAKHWADKGLAEFITYVRT